MKKIEAEYVQFNIIAAEEGLAHAQRRLGRTLEYIDSGDGKLFWFERTIAGRTFYTARRGSLLLEVIGYGDDYWHWDLIYLHDDDGDFGQSKTLKGAKAAAVKALKKWSDER